MRWVYSLALPIQPYNRPPTPVLARPLFPHTSPAQPYFYVHFQSTIYSFQPIPVLLSMRRLTNVLFGSINVPQHSLVDLPLRMIPTLSFGLQRRPPSHWPRHLATRLMLHLTQCTPLQTPSNQWVWEILLQPLPPSPKSPFHRGPRHHPGVNCERRNRTALRATRATSARAQKRKSRKIAQKKKSCRPKKKRKQGNAPRVYSVRISPQTKRFR